VAPDSEPEVQQQEEHVMKGVRTASVLATIGLGVVTGLSTASPAAAATTARSDACNSVVCGSGTFTWASNTRLSGGSMSVKRTCGTGSGGSVIQIQVFESGNGLVSGPEHPNNSACGTLKRFPASGSTSWTSSGGNICWWRVVVAATPQFNHITNGNQQVNPNHPAGC